MKKVKVGLIGYGYWGPNIARILSESDFAELAYCADLLESSRKQINEKHPHITTTDNYKVMLEDPSVEAVCIVTPTKSHYKIAKDALLAGKHVFVEKPLTYSLHDAQELERIAREKKLKLMVGHVFLFNPAVEYIKNVIDARELGELRHLHFQRRNLGPIRQDVNAMWDLAPHDISMIIYFLNEMPESVVASGQSFIQKNIYDVVSVSLKFASGSIANMFFSWIDPVKIRDVTIVGSKKMLLFDDVEPTHKIKIFDKNVDILKNTSGKTFGEYVIALRSGNTTIPEIPQKEPLKEELMHFITCIVENRTPKTDGVNGIQVVRVLDAIQKSLDNSSQLVTV